MPRHRLTLLVVAVLAAGALVLTHQLGGDEEPRPAVDTPASARSADHPADDRAGTRPGDPAADTRDPNDRSATSAGPSAGPTSHPADDEEPGETPGDAAPPHDASGVSGDESLAEEHTEAVLTTAGAFATRWTAGGDDWHEALTPYATQALADALTDASPPAPAPSVTGDPRLWHDTPQWARVAVPTDRGTLALDVVATGDSGDTGDSDDTPWRVAAVDWRPA